MSITRRQIELKAPSMNKPDETLVSTGHRCEYCQGNGYFWSEQDNDPDPIKTPCPMCNGKGMLDAIVTIKWKPSNRE